MKSFYEIEIALSNDFGCSIINDSAKIFCQINNKEKNFLQRFTENKLTPLPNPNLQAHIPLHVIGIHKVLLVNSYIMSINTVRNFGYINVK